MFSTRDGGSDRQIDDSDAPVDRHRSQETIARRRRRYGIHFQPTLETGFSLPEEQHDPLGAQLSATTDTARAFPSSLSSSWSSGGFGGTAPYHAQARLEQGGLSGVQRGDNNLFANNSHLTGDKEKGLAQSSPVGNNGKRVRVYYGAEIVDIERLDALPPLPSLFPDRYSYRPLPLRHPAHDPQRFMPGTTQAATQQSDLSSSERPFVIGVNHLDDPFVRTPEPQAVEDFQPGDTRRATSQISPLPGNGRLDDLTGLTDLLTKSPESPYERPPNPGGFRREPNSQAFRGEQAQRPFVLGLDTILHPFSDTPIVPDEPWRAETTLLSNPLTTMGRANSNRQEDFGMPDPGENSDNSRPTPSAPASIQEVGATDGQSADQRGRPAPGHNAAGRQQNPSGKARRVDLVDSPEVIEGPIGPLPGAGPSFEGSKSGDGREDAEPEFPKQVYNVLLVGAAGVGQTSMIQYEPLIISGDGKMLISGQEPCQRPLDKRREGGERMSQTRTRTPPFPLNETKR